MTKRATIAGGTPKFSFVFSTFLLLWISIIAQVDNYLPSFTEIAPTGQLSTAFLIVVSLSPAGSIGSLFPPSPNLKLLGAIIAQTPQPIHFSLSTLTLILPNLLPLNNSVNR
jgi:hypothetical protein